MNEDERFIDNGDGTITDTLTGLMWQQTDDGINRSWEESVEYSKNLNLADFQDWILPRIDELVSIVDYNIHSPAIDHVFNAHSTYYWSGSTNAYNPDYAWNVNFYNGDVYANGKNSTYYVRCVRVRS